MTTIKNKITENFHTNKLPELDYLTECFTCDPDVGVLFWNKRPIHHFNNIRDMNKWNGKFAGKKAGNLYRGYMEVCIDNVTTRSHRVIWKLYHGEEPNNIIDHINGIKDDNRKCNLRLSNHIENAMNVLQPVKNNTSGYTGVKYFADRDRYYASINYEGENISLGYYHTVEEGALARELKFKELYGKEFYNSCGRDTLLQELTSKVEEILNTRSMNITTKRNSTGYTGVVINKKNNKYRSRIGYDKKLLSLGEYDTPEEAALVYQLKYIELYGEDKYLRLVGSKTLLQELKDKVEEIKNNRLQSN